MKGVSLPAQAWVYQDKLTSDAINQSTQASMNGWKYEEINTAQWEDDPALSCLAFPLLGKLEHVWHVDEVERSQK